jgi:hypothetical protein
MHIFLFTILQLSQAMAQSDSNLTYYGRYFINHSGSSNNRVVSNNREDGSILLSLPSYRDTLLQRRIYLTKSSERFYVDINLLNANQVTAKGYLRSDSITLRHGQSWQFREDASLRASGEYQNDRKNGNWTYYDKKGRVRSLVLYVNDSAVQRTCFMEKNGKLVRSAICNRRPTLTVSLDSISLLMGQFLEENKIKGEKAYLLLVFINEDAKVIGHSHLEKEDSFWKAMMKYYQLIQWSQPALRDGIEVGCTVDLLFAFKMEKGKRYSTVDIKIVQTRIMEN